MFWLKAEQQTREKEERIWNRVRKLHELDLGLAPEEFDFYASSSFQKGTFFLLMMRLYADTTYPIADTSLRASLTS